MKESLIAICYEGKDMVITMKRMTNSLPYWIQKQGLIRKNTSIKENDSYLDMFMPTQPYVSQKTPRPNDLCPCGREKNTKMLWKMKCVGIVE